MRLRCNVQKSKCNIYYHIIETKIGPITLSCDEIGLTMVNFGAIHMENVKNKPHEILKQTEFELQEYFNKKRTDFDIPLHMIGTDFQKKTWNALCTIPYGETRTYSQIARIIGNPKASRAVGMANHNNPIAILVPCHRVIGKNGSLTGYAGGLDIKDALLKLEQL